MQGKTISGYTIQHVLGVGGMAEVWLAENKIGKKAAVKLLLPKFCDDENVTSRFLTEAKVMVDLNHHNIRQVYDFGDIDGRSCIVMEYLEGDDLKARMKRGQKFTEQELEKWWNQLVDALNYTHAKGIVHRDIKPGNIFVDTNGNIKLLDFGIAKIRESISSTQTGQKLGTLMYMSPEQVKDSKNIDYHTDNYSLAVTFVHLITGKRPYDSDTSSDFEISEQIVYKPLDLTGLPANWQQFLEPYLNKDPQDRPDLKPFPAAVSVPQHPQTDADDDETIVGDRTQVISSAPAVKSQHSDDETFVESGGVIPHPVQENSQKDSGPAQENPKKNKKKRRIIAIVCSSMAVLVAAAVVTVILLFRGSSEPLSSGPSELYRIADETHKWGYIDQNGNEIVACQYDFAGDFSEGLALVCRNGKCGYIDQTGSEVIACQYDVARNFSEGLACVYRDGKYGFIDQTGNEVIACQYDVAGEFKEGLTDVIWNGKYGLIDKKGKMVVVPQYERFLFFSEGMAAVEREGKWGYINKTGDEVVSCQYDGTWSFSEGLAAVERGGKWGYVDKAGNEVIACQYDGASGFSEGMAVVSRNGKCGFIDKTGSEVIACQYDGARDFSEGLAVVIRNGKYGFIDETGNEVIACQYGDASGFSEGMAQIKIDEKYGYIDKTGKVVIEPLYDYCNFFNGRAIVKMGNKVGIVDKTGKMLNSIKCNNDVIGRWFKDLVVVCLNDNTMLEPFVYFNKSGDIVYQKAVH